jgi:hypothetical protein
VSSRARVILYWYTKQIAKVPKEANNQDNIADPENTATEYDNYTSN